MKRICFIIALLLLFCGCNEDINEIESIPDGVYTGTYQREYAHTSPTLISNITLAFTSGTWWGTSSTPRYPALCNGDFTIKNGIINFENQCVWTADFDWSFILSGEYSIAQNGDVIEFYRKSRPEITPAFTDRFIITLTEK